ncbi:drug/metabolite transporter (DMT)-like permease [Loktanella ponticola]|uniref:Drug/metabolite transporter (DMT)-like permease n=1 Tax=Yoonia ponticola TaxID=1524255 RepID=A0A7W9EZZ4_9RHOB|nr:DMT family transporter [Yoonia ponticola]MBB5722680.1 drug/metabolite transporter (DMT)-like permease [Yoonia ponticola]
MKLFILVTLTMVAFAANSILNRVGVATYGMDPMGFAVIRTLAGAVTLTILVVLRGTGGMALWNRKRGAGAVALAIYMIGFSWSYLTLGAGLGALILFGVLQVVMFGWAVIEGQRIAPIRWLGAGVAMIGLVVLLWPGGGAAVPFAGAMVMALAGVAWAAYTLLGRGEPDALAASAGNFVLCFPLVVGLLAIVDMGSLTMSGVLVAVTAGALTSGLGYALWYRCLPQLATVTAAVAQLSVPVIAVAAGVFLLAEPVTQRLLIAGILVLGGIAISLKPSR